MYTDRGSNGRSRKRDMQAGGMSPADPALHVADLYTRLAADRAVAARAALRHSHDSRELLAQSAQALEDAAGTLTLASEMYAGM